MGDSKYRPISAFPPAEKALYQLARRCPMIAEELSRITPLVVAPGALKGSPAAIDKYWRLYIDPKGWTDMIRTDGEGVAVLMHEFGHVAKDHFRRCARAGLSQDEGNTCADFEENSSLILSGFKLPEDLLFPGNYGLPDGLLLEEYAELLRNQQGQQPGGSTGSGNGESGEGAPGSGPQSGDDGDEQSGADGSSGSGSGQDKRDSGNGSSGSKSGSGDQSGNEQAGSGGSPSVGHKKIPVPVHGSAVQETPGEWEAGPPEKSGIPGVSEIEGEMIRQNLARKIVEAPNKSSLPAGLHRWASAYLSSQSKVDWRKELRAVLNGTIKLGLDDTTYSRRSRRQSGVQARLPASIEHSVSIGIIIDTSGSIDDAMLEQAAAETLALARKYDATVFACGCDAQSSCVRKVRKIADLKEILVGNGGSDMRPAEDALAKLKGLSAVVYIGDGDATFYESPRIRARHIAVITSPDSRVCAPSHWRQVKV